jgi:outer membrane protein assembly factor BamB
MSDDHLPVQQSPPAMATAPAIINQASAVTATAAPRPRLWPGLGIVAAQWLVLTLPSLWWPGTQLQLDCLVWGAIGGAAAVTLWWLFVSRAPWLDRGLGVLTFAACAVLSYPLFHPTLTYRMYGPIIRGLPLATTAWVLWLTLTPMLAWPGRRVGMLTAIALAWGYCTLLRMDGVDGSFTPTVSWRWDPTPEERFLAERSQRQNSPGERVAPTLQPGDWPGFRGPNRDGRLAGVRIASNWREQPPRLVWRQRVGPGWSSFAVVGDLLYTQEQRGQDEAVVCYQAATGTEVWAHTDPVRFSETIGGPGPRSTPTFHQGRLFALGATGKLNCLDPATGAVVWSRDIVADSGAELPTWGFSSSPLVAKDIVTVFAGAANGKSVLAYHAANGAPAWTAGDGRFSYSSTHLAKLAGVEQILLSSEKGLSAFEPATGQLLWHDELPPQQGGSIAQPAVLSDAEVVYGKNFYGTRRLHVTHEMDRWSARQVWVSKAIKPYFNDFVMHDGHLYGIDGSFFVCVNLSDGKGRWRTRGYGNGQVLLLADQGLLLILSETGEVALVQANPEQHSELTRFSALEGKTWNHPVLVRGRLFVRNGEEMACFALAED